MKHLFFPLVSGLLIFAGCSKDAPEAAKVVLDGNYEAASTLAAAPITMYTKDGPVNNPALVDRFLSRQYYANGFFSRNDVTLPPMAYGSLTLSIRGNKQATFTTVYPSTGVTDTLKTEIIAQRATHFVAAKLDSVSILTSAASADRCSQLSTQMEVESQAKRCVNVSIATGYSQLCKFRPIQVIKINAGQLYIPRLSWLIQSGNVRNSGCGRAASGSSNLFNTGVLNQLVAGDTLVVQERTIALLKK
jgi:hypothetical protein